MSVCDGCEFVVAVRVCDVMAVMVCDGCEGL